MDWRERPGCRIAQQQRSQKRQGVHTVCSMGRPAGVQVTILNPSPCGVFPILNLETAVQWQEKDLQSHTDVASLMTPDGLACLPLGLRHHILRKPKLHAEATIDVLADSPSFSCQTYE
ncbi:uncharacterized protein [Macaca nemestrina]|uniref:uncharacterized protein n=1 Tax=Macaca nemestrina TaxID=9545 RepID=UPI0039B91C28